MGLLQVVRDARSSDSWLGKANLHDRAKTISQMRAEYSQLSTEKGGGEGKGREGSGWGAVGRMGVSLNCTPYPQHYPIPQLPVPEYTQARLRIPL